MHCHPPTINKKQQPQESYNAASHPRLPKINTRPRSLPHQLPVSCLSAGDGQLQTDTHVARFPRAKLPGHKSPPGRTPPNGARSTATAWSWMEGVRHWSPGLRVVVNHQSPSLAGVKTPSVTYSPAPAPTLCCCWYPG